MSQPVTISQATPEQLVLRSERVLFAVIVAVSLLLYYLLARALATNPESGGALITYVVLFAGLLWLTRALGLGHLRGNGVRVGPHQFPLLHRLVELHAERLGLRKLPAVFVVQSGGALNAFATRFLGRGFVVVNSDILELALRQGERAVGFIVAHELGHHWRGHLKWRWLTAPGRMVPYLGSAYSRACEYTCDRLGAYCEVNGAVEGLLVLAAGKVLRTEVDAATYASQAQTERGYWVWVAERLASHPRLPKRVAALLKLGVPAVREPEHEDLATSNGSQVLAAMPA